MKITKKLSLFSLEEARKQQYLLSFYDPSLLSSDLLQKVSEITFDSLLLDKTYFSELFTFLNIQMKSVEEYTNKLEEAFRFYSRDVYIHTRNLLFKFNEKIKLDELKHLIESNGWFETENQTIRLIQNLNQNSTVNGNNILEIEDEKFFRFRTQISLLGNETAIDNKSILLSSRQVNSFFCDIFFDQPELINTLLIPFMIPFPKYIKYVLFKNISGQTIYSISNLSSFSNEYQAEILFPPIVVSSIKIFFQDVPFTKAIERNTLEDSLTKTLRGLVLNNHEGYLVGASKQENSYELPISVSIYPSLRKYKHSSTIRAPLNYSGSLNACFVYAEEVHFNSEGVVVANPLTNIDYDFVLQKENNLEFYSITNIKNRNAQKEKFLLVDQEYKYSLLNNVPIKNVSMKLRKNSGENIDVSSITKPTHIQIYYPRKQTLVMQYEFETLTRARDKARIDFENNLVFNSAVNPSNTFLNIKLSRLSNNPYITPIFKYLICGLIR